jgi:hypothetical protein
MAWLFPCFKRWRRWRKGVSLAQITPRDKHHDILLSSRSSMCDFKALAAISLEVRGRALLAPNIGWRLIKKPNGLVARCRVGGTHAGARLDPKPT